MDKPTLYILQVGRASRLLMIKHKSMILFGEGHMEDIEHIKNIFGVDAKSIGTGLKYLGFNIKPNNYIIKD